MSNDKKAEEILVKHSPNPKGGYRGSWIIGAMHEYSAQQLKEYKDKLREAFDIINEIQDNWISSDHYWGSPTNDTADNILEGINKLIDQTDTK